jgi:hypothetical protein
MPQAKPYIYNLMYTLLRRIAYGKPERSGPNLGKQSQNFYLFLIYSSIENFYTVTMLHNSKF